MQEVWRKVSCGILTPMQQLWQPTTQQTRESARVGVLSHRGATVETLIPLNRYSFFEELSDRLLPPIHLEFEIVLQDDNEIIFQNDGTARRIVVRKFELWVPQLTLKQLLNAAAAFSLLCSDWLDRWLSPHLRLWRCRSFGAEKALKKIFGNGYGANEIKLYNLVQAMSPSQKKAVRDYLVRQGVVRGGGTAQYGWFLGMLASICVHIAIDLISKMFGKGLQVGPPRPPRSGGKGIYINPPPFFGSWDDYKKKWCSKTFRFPILI